MCDTVSMLLTYVVYLCACCFPFKLTPLQTYFQPLAVDHSGVFRVTGSSQMSGCVPHITLLVLIPIGEMHPLTCVLTARREVFVLRLCALLTSLICKKKQDQRAKNNKQRCAERRPAAALMKLRTYASSFTLGGIMALSLCLRSACFAT